MVAVTTGESTRRRSRLVAALIALLLAGIAVGGVYAATRAPTSASFLRVPWILSKGSNVNSLVPDLAVSPDQETVAVVWVDERAEGIRMGHVYLRAAPAAGAGWGNKVTVFSATEEAAVYRASIAVTASTAHVAYLVVGSNLFQLRHRTCQLPEGPCNDDEVIVRSGTHDISWVDLAIDDSGCPHMVWPEDPGDGPDIHYAADMGSGWVITDVATSESNQKPSIWMSGGYAHIAWLREDSERDTDVRYRRCHISTGCGSEVGLSGSPEPEEDYPPGVPVVAAGDGRVFVVWDRCANYLGGPHCDTFNLLYRRSNDNGNSWLTDTYEVGSAYTYTQYAEYLQYYDSISLLGSERKGRLKPSVAVSSGGWPAVAWHADRSEGDGTDYVIYYSYATSGTISSVDWITRTLLSGDREAVRVGSSIGVGREEGVECRDVGYMLEQTDWEVMYDSDIEYLEMYIPLVLKE
jgi:hypothetical protein